jgi:hypothetical protein
MTAEPEYLIVDHRGEVIRRTTRQSNLRLIAMGLAARGQADTFEVRLRRSQGEQDLHWGSIRVEPDGSQPPRWDWSIEGPGWSESPGCIIV